MPSFDPAAEGCQHGADPRDLTDLEPDDQALIRALVAAAEAAQANGAIVTRVSPEGDGTVALHVAVAR